jgi:hypothetical protein
VREAQRFTRHKGPRALPRYDDNRRDLSGRRAAEFKAQILRGCAVACVRGNDKPGGPAKDYPVAFEQWTIGRVVGRSTTLPILPHQGTDLRSSFMHHISVRCARLISDLG